MLVSLFLLNTESYCSLNTVISSITEKGILLVKIIYKDGSVDSMMLYN